MAQYLAPGVYVEEVSFRAPSIEGVGTSTAAFVGPTLTGPINQTPELLTSFGDFQNIYGGYDNLAISSDPTDPKNTNFLALSVKGFFDNGGSDLYVSRVFVPASTTNLGIASSGTAGNSNVTVSAQFPGEFGNQAVTVALKAVKTQNVSAQPPGSLIATVPPGTAAVALVTAAVTTAETNITIAPALTGPAPASVLIDSEIMAVTAVNTANTELTVTRGSNGTTAAAHATGVPVFTRAASTAGAIAATDTTVTLSATIPGNPGTLQIEQEIVTVTAWDSTGLKPTITRGAGGTNAAAHAANSPVFATSSLTFYTNGTTGTFQNGTIPIATPLPANLYTFTVRVTANGASGSPQVFDGLGFDPAHPNYLGAALGATPPRHIDALQNQISFNIGSSLTPVTLYEAIFGQTRSPLNATATFTLTGGDDGLEPESTDYDNALSYLTALEDVAIVASPGSGAFEASQDIINSLITHVSQQRAYRIAILETPANQLASDNENVRAQIDSSYAALYVPWVIVPNPLATSGSSIPAEIARAAVWLHGGHLRAQRPAERRLQGARRTRWCLSASRFERNITFDEQQVLNPLGINCLRYFPNRGYRSGAHERRVRTRSSCTSTSGAT